LIVQTFLEQELHQAVERRKIKLLPHHPEDHACRCPSARKVIDLFVGILRHEFKQPAQVVEVMTIELSPCKKANFRAIGHLSEELRAFVNVAVHVVI